MRTDPIPLGTELRWLAAAIVLATDALQAPPPPPASSPATGMIVGEAGF